MKKWFNLLEKNKLGFMLFSIVIALDVFLMSTVFRDLRYIAQEKEIIFMLIGAVLVTGYFKFWIPRHINRDMTMKGETTLKKAFDIKIFPTMAVFSTMIIFSLLAIISFYIFTSMIAYNEVIFCLISVTLLLHWFYVYTHLLLRNKFYSRESDDITAFTLFITILMYSSVILMPISYLYMTLVLILLCMITSIIYLFKTRFTLMKIKSENFDLRSGCFFVDYIPTPFQFKLQQNIFKEERQEKEYYYKFFQNALYIGELHNRTIDSFTKDELIQKIENNTLIVVDEKIISKYFSKEQIQDIIKNRVIILYGNQNFLNLKDFEQTNIVQKFIQNKYKRYQSDFLNKL